MAVFRSELERSWARTVLMLGLLITLFAVMRLAPAPAFSVARQTLAPAPAAVVATSATPAAVMTPPPAPAVAGSQSPSLLFPLAGYEHALRDNFHEKRGMRVHKALDIMAPRGTPVRAVEDGRIAKLYRGPMAGIAVYQFNRDETRVYFYAHLDRRAEGLVEGQPIARGDLVGYVGSTGNAPETAPHLHFSMHELGPDKRWWKGEALNPYALLREAGVSGEAVAANRTAETRSPRPR
jgi:murein DD-endopeptidase MepM/ murein hydrolase activator NlpD